MGMKRVRSLVLLASIGVVLLLVGGGLVVNVGAAESSYRQAVLFAEVLSQVSDNYVDPIDPAVLLDGAYEGMLAGLDPNGAYLTPGEVVEVSMTLGRSWLRLRLQAVDEDGQALARERIDFRVEQPPLSPVQWWKDGDAKGRIEILVLGPARGGPERELELWTIDPPRSALVPLAPELEPLTELGTVVLRPTVRSRLPAPR